MTLTCSLCGADLEKDGYMRVDAYVNYRVHRITPTAIELAPPDYQIFDDREFICSNCDAQVDVDREVIYPEVLSAEPV